MNLHPALGVRRVEPRSVISWRTASVCHQHSNLSDSILRRCAGSHRIARCPFMLSDGTTAAKSKKQAHKVFADDHQSRLQGTSKIACVRAEKPIHESNTRLGKTRRVRLIFYSRFGQINLRAFTGALCALAVPVTLLDRISCSPC